LERLARKALEEQRRGVVGIGILRACRHEVRREARQAGGVRCEVDEADLFFVLGPWRRPAGQELAHGVFQADFVRFDRHGEEQTGKDFRDRADLEKGVGVRRIARRRIRDAVTGELCAGLAQKAHDQPDA
jgi:hypothetical protein